MREYSVRLEREIFNEDGLEEPAEFRETCDEKNIFSKNVLGELRCFCVVSELIKVCGMRHCLFYETLRQKN